MFLKILIFLKNHVFEIKKKSYFSEISQIKKKTCFLKISFFLKNHVFEIKKSYFLEISRIKKKTCFFDFLEKTRINRKKRQFRAIMISSGWLDSPP